MDVIHHSHCPLCGDINIAEFLDLSDYSISKETFGLAKCVGCNFVFTQNPPTKAEAGKYYQSDAYISHSDSKKGVINKVYHGVREFMLGRKYRLLSELSKEKSILDMGTGTGYFLNFMKQNGYKTTGIEISEDARKFAKDTFQLDVFAPDYLLSGQLQTTFSLITMWHVLEHIYQPSKTMESIKNVLADDGHLIIAVPNKDAVDAEHYGQKWAGYDVPRHLWHFTPETMTRFAKKHGFTVIKKKMLPFDSFYVSMLSEKYAGNGLPFLRGMWFGLISYLRALKDVDKASSIIYVLRKAQ